MSEHVDHLDHGVVNPFLRGLEYPLDRQRLLELAQANDMTGVYREALADLPARRYASQAEVMAELERRGYRLS